MHRSASVISAHTVAICRPNFVFTISPSYALATIVATPSTSILFSLNFKRIPILNPSKPFIVSAHSTYHTHSFADTCKNAFAMICGGQFFLKDLFQIGT